MGKGNVFAEIYKIVKKVPKGKVLTYGQVAKLASSSAKPILKTKKITPNIVGWALHANKDINVPCHRIVSKNGRLATNFTFNGIKEQRKRLMGEKVKFKDEIHVDLDESLWEKKN